MPVQTALLPLTAEQTQAMVADYLADYCRRQRHQAQAIAGGYARFWEMLSDYLSAPAKRVRPYILLLSYQAFGGQAVEDVLPIAAAWELLHASLLIHDDIIDHDQVRHGRPNISGRYRQHYAAFQEAAERAHYADAAALLAGDALLSEAYQQVLASPVSSADCRAVLGLLGQAIFEVAAGELVDMEASLPGSAAPSPELIADYKTASYTFIGPLLSGAVLAGADRSLDGALRRLGQLLGRGYQLADDLLGIFGEQQHTGKSITSDLAAGRRTKVVLESLALMPAAQRAQAAALLDSVPLSAAQTRQLFELIASTNVRQQLHRQLADYRRDCQAIIEGLPIAPAYAAALAATVAACLERST